MDDSLNGTGLGLVFRIDLGLCVGRAIVRAVLQGVKVKAKGYMQRM